MKKCATFLGVGLHLYAEKPLGGRALMPRSPLADGNSAVPVNAPVSVRAAASVGTGSGNGAPPRATTGQVSGAAPEPPGGGNGVSGIRAAAGGLDTSRVDAGLPGRGADNTTPPAKPAPGNGVTARQLDAIVKVALAKGIAPAEIDAMSLRAFSRKPGALTRAEASSLIKELSNMKRRVA
jgi:hypothetical protein